ncbi:Two-component sensor histidine kinase, contains HisKA and HATPase domains [Novosphingobium sp. CF614]|uniref:CHASE domain-containing protein n=1 Tax=Novosphingobium sp. CF614 TaxID=1884364 RepID=UPI0008E54199|nr:CHASE domain-containing protein [Novosphingobium sp. CF614]SFG34914.1 Two-component sensor histidine kinase, contains HisKA and HATPase domains [Novosphingobium sp. CF614]
MIDQALLDRVHKQAWFYRYPRGWPFLLFLLASITTAVSVMAIERADRQTRQVELDRNLTEIASALQRRVTENIALLRAGSALFATQETVSPEQFAEFADDLQGDGTLYGSLGIGWAPLVPVDQIPTLEAALQKDRQEDFIVWPRPSGDQGYAAPIVYLEPRSQDNRRVVAYDMFSERVRRSAMENAMRLGGPVASGKVRLIQDRNAPEVAGFLIYMPVMVARGGQRQVKGFVYSPFRAASFLDSASELYRNSRIEVAIYDDHVAPDTLLAERQAEELTGPTMERRIDVGNHSWVVQISDTKGGVLSPLSRITLFFGMLASLMVMAIGRLITRRAAEDRRVLEWLTSQASIRDSLTRELNHRVKNTLANVLSIAALTRRRSKDIDDFTESLTARLRALSATHDLLSQSDWGNAALGDIVRSELAPYLDGNEGHVEMSGPDIKLAPNDAMSLGLAIHELATNAAKYGALTTVEGRIHIFWSLVSPDCAEIHWREEGGPTVSEPAKRGFGRDLIEKIVAHELKSNVDLKFNPGGVECRLKVPVRTSREFALRGGKLRKMLAG